MLIEKIFKNLITKFGYYLILSYILIIIGIIINSYICINNSNIYFIIYVILISIFFLNILLINNIKIDDKTKREIFKVKFYKLDYTKTLQKLTQEKCIKYLKITTTLTLVSFPIIFGGWYHSMFIHTSTSYLKLISITFLMTLVISICIRGEVFQNDNNFLFNTFFLIVALIFMPQTLVLNIQNWFLNYIINNSSVAINILIAIIMLGVGLSALSFGYCSILKEDSNTRENMKNNGEGYFIVSILSMIAIIFLFLTSIIKEYVIFMPLSNLNIMSFDFLILNIYSLFMILIFTLTIYASYCLLKYSILTLKELKLFEIFF